MSENPDNMRFQPPHFQPRAPNADYLPSSEEARAGMYATYGERLTVYQSLMERYSNGFSERVKQANQRRASRLRLGR